MRQPLTDSELLSLSDNGKLQLILEDSPNSKAVLIVDINKPLNNNLQSSLESFVEETNKLIQAHALASRIDELERLIGSGAAGDKYRTKAKHGFVTIEERLEQLKEQSNE